LSRGGKETKKREGDEEERRRRRREKETKKMKETFERTTMWMSEREMKSAIPKTWMETLELPARSTKHEIPSNKHAEDSA